LFKKKGAANHPKDGGSTTVSCEQREHCLCGQREQSNSATVYVDRANRQMASLSMWKLVCLFFFGKTNCQNSLSQIKIEKE
jgi:hypothetical protein